MHISLLDFMPTEHNLQLEDFWKLEHFGISEPVSVNDVDKAL